MAAFTKSGRRVGYSVEKQNEFVLVEGVTEIFATELAHEFKSANVVCQILPSEKEEACLCIPIGEPRKRWNALGVLVSR